MLLKNISSKEAIKTDHHEQFKYENLDTIILSQRIGSACNITETAL